MSSKNICLWIMVGLFIYNAQLMGMNPLIEDNLSKDRTIFADYPMGIVRPAIDTPMFLDMQQRFAKTHQKIHHLSNAEMIPYIEGLRDEAKAKHKRPQLQEALELLIEEYKGKDPNWRPEPRIPPSSPRESVFQRRIKKEQLIKEPEIKPIARIALSRLSGAGVMETPPSSPREIKPIIESSFQELFNVINDVKFRAEIKQNACRLFADKIKTFEDVKEVLNKRFVWEPELQECIDTIKERIFANLNLEKLGLNSKFLSYQEALYLVAAKDQRWKTDEIDEIELFDTMKQDRIDSYLQDIELPSNLSLLDVVFLIMAKSKGWDITSVGMYPLFQKVSKSAKEVINREYQKRFQPLRSSIIEPNVPKKEVGQPEVESLPQQSESQGWWLANKWAQLKSWFATKLYGQAGSYK